MKATENVRDLSKNLRINLKHLEHIGLVTKGSGKVNRSGYGSDGITEAHYRLELVA